MKNNKSFNKKDYFYSKINPSFTQRLNDDMVSDKSSISSNNNNSLTNNHIYPNFRNSKTNVIFNQKQQLRTLANSNSVSSINIYSKGRIQKIINKTNNNFNTNNIIINNTNIINNNRTNIINNNIVNTNKDYKKSISQLNIEQIKELTKNNQNKGNIQIINNIMRPRLVVTKRKFLKKNNITIKDNNFLIENFDKPNKRKMTEIDFSDRNKKKDFKTNLDDFKDNFNNINLKRNNEEKNIIFNIEEMLMIEEKLSSLINCLVDCNPCTEECFEFLNFYFTTKFSKNLNVYFSNKNYLIIIKRAINLKLFSFILCYDISLNENLFPHYIVTLDELFGHIHEIFILISKYFCNKIIESNNNMWVKKLQNLINNYDPEKKSSNIIFDEIDNLCYKLTDNLFPFVLQKYNHQKIIEIYNELNTLTQNDLYRLFRDNIFINMNINGSIIASSSYFEKNKNNLNEPIPSSYLINNSKKKYTLVLDLDETLIHFKVNPKNNNSGILQFRPYISEFLSNIKNYYELIVFTAATKEYADPIIDAIEQKGTKFDHRLYRIHINIRGNDFVKDISKLGRDLSRIIIVDNMEQNYKLQPYNGITIRPFWGKDTNDMALFDLFNILIKIAKMDMDVRDGIRYFKEDIISKVTSNIFRRVQN